ncbi:MAG: amidohydrolase family protein [Rubrivivax sp.]
MTEAAAPSPPLDAAWDCHVHVFDAAWPRPPGHAGHYEVHTHTLGDAMAQAAVAGVERLVLVQPSIYGGDNRLLLRALAQAPGRHRGVVVLGATATAAELAELHGAGVRALRLNLVSPLGTCSLEEAQAQLARLAPDLRALGWHVQWYAGAGQLAALAELQAKLGLVFVLDHLAGLNATADAQAWRAAQTLARGGAWIKLSGWYRLGANRAPYDTMHRAVERAIDVFGPRCVWGSDWPHTGLAPALCPGYAELLAPLAMSAGDSRWRAVMIEAPLRLYD